MAVGLFGDRPVTVTGYRSPESGQVEVSVFLDVTAGSTWQTIHTVTSGKTFYLSTIVLANADALTRIMRIGKSGTTIFETQTPPTDTLIINLPIPMPFTSGTIIQVYSDDPSHLQTFSLVGFEE